MEKNEIKKRVQGIKDKEELLALLNDIKADVFGNKCYPFTMKQINFYCNPHSVPNSKRYHDFYIPKKNGGQRLISAPLNGLKSIQTILNIVFQSIYEPSPYAMGFTQNRSIVDNAKIHTSYNYIFNIDIKDFFPSIQQARVWGRLKVQPFNFSKEIANLIAGLCCMKKMTTNSNKCILPQGAPTSPILSNAICDKLDYKLSKLAQHYGLHYSRYADDITFSSMHNVYQNGSIFLKTLFKIIQEQGFTVNEDKTRLQKKGSRQEVTGLIVNNKVNVNRKYTDSIRNILYIWEKYGLSVAYFRFISFYNKEKGYVKKGNHVLEKVLAGKLEYLKMVKGENDSTYLKLKARYDALKNMPVTGEKGIKFLNSQKVSDFENKIDTKIELKKSKRGRVFGLFLWNKKIYNITVSKSVQTSNLSDLQISLCENQKKERFFLIHNPIGNKTMIAMQTPTPHTS